MPTPPRRSRRTYSSDSLKIMVIAVALMLFVKLVVLKDRSGESALQAPPMPPAVEQVLSPQHAAKPDFSGYDMPAAPAIVPNVLPAPLEVEIVPEVTPVPVPSSKASPPQPPSLINGQRPKIVIIIDDMGVSVKNSRDVAALPSPLTLAYLPYADNLPRMTSKAKARGHELMVHVPMEAMNADMDLGGVKLTSSMDSAAMDSELNEKVFTAFEGYKGINNHMGSRLTQDAGRMALVMGHLKRRGLYFVDSRTISTSIAADMAVQAGVDVAVRDVFLDHYESRAEIAKALAKLERIAAKNGVAIGIGHPKPNTVAALKSWLPTLKGKGFDLVPASVVVE